MKISTQSLISNDLRVIGRLVDASNATLMAEIENENEILKVIYKPIAGEKPLWDFQDGHLAHREYCAFVLSDLAEFNLVPKTVLRDGPFGYGMVQEWIETDEDVDIVSFGQSKDPQLKKMSLFDAVVNNTDRKYGHLLVEDGNLFGCDHGVTFHAENKLRTVIWQFADEELGTQEKQLLQKSYELEYGKIFDSLLTNAEIDALYARIELLIEESRFPVPSDSWPAIPWPPV